ncbi:retinal guanylyl cyclase 2-like [Tachypleus tridentatus]|uniref:retinal guanylyl cyclase 2-like n=1 Tax=Tachypleus tridentatus TaxID=6853 RepID=UPI003FD38D70
MHISKTTEKKLRRAGGYFIQHRGEIILKGKGKQPTYWLCGKTGFNKDLPPPPQDDGNEDNHGFKSENIFKAMGRKKVDGTETDNTRNQGSGTCISSYTSSAEINIDAEPHNDSKHFLSPTQTSIHNH